MFSGGDSGSHVFNGMSFLNTAQKSTPRYQNSQWGGDFTPSPLGSLGSPLSESLDLFNDTSLAAMQRVTQPPCNPFQQGAYIYKNQQLQSLHDHCKTLEMQIVKITAEHDTILSSFQLLAGTVQLHDADPFKFNTTFISPSRGDRPNSETHTDIKFWNKSEYLTWLDSHEAQLGNRGKLPYLEQEDGDPVQDDEIDVIHKLCGVHFLNSTTGDSLQCVGTHPIFRLANNSWKLHYLAMSSYPSWQRNHIENGASENGKKRKHSTSSIKLEINEKKIKIDSSVSPIIADPELPGASASTSPATGSSGSDPTEPVLELPAAGPLTSPAVESPGLDSTEPVRLELPTAGPSTSLATELPELDPKEPVLDSATAASASPLSLLQKLNQAFESSPCAGASLPLQPPVPNFPPVAPSPLAQEIKIVNPLTAIALAVSQIILPPPPPANPSLESPPDTTITVKKGKSSGTKSSTKGKMCPSQTKNGRNLCALRWLKQTKLNGTTEEFNAYYNSLTSTQRMEYDQDTANLVASNAWNKTHNQFSLGLINDGSAAVLINEALTLKLGLHHRKLPKPVSFNVALSGEMKDSFVLLEYVNLSCTSLDSRFTSRTVCAIIAPHLCMPLLLGGPFLHHDKVVIDHDLRTCIAKDGGYDLLNPQPTKCKPSLTPSPLRMHELRNEVVRELKYIVISRIPDLHPTIFPRLIRTFGRPIHVSSPLPIRIPAPLYIHIRTSTSRSLYLRTSDLHTSAASLHHSSFVLLP
ncbi:uncharacterized protein HD556DRAFT_1444508 [Suillus plorans]|uniref:Uncharacterized protein n=1 Tax=Suillus plorans TaxID=116603 RepID=A0A9P7AMJ5_9AGAM|nr:uncharacterized protein HD556DRAFT_1444508 [Suillus plorans]KAG1792514.1 hypothetical protein HD556DRAFT_1444508 [Suillus plorans]